MAHPAAKPQPRYDESFSHLSRICVCRVGQGYSVENRQTGERISYHRSAPAAFKRAREERGNLRAILRGI